MIKSFGNKGLEAFFSTGKKKGIQPDHAQKLADILDRLEAAHVIEDMKFPGAVLHPLKGKLKGFWSVRVSGDWRVIFRFQNGDAFDGNYMDYH